MILLLDIDNTILHASGNDFPQEEFENLKLYYNEYITQIKISHPVYPKIKQTITLKLRPRLKTFLESIRDKYEIYIYTYGTKDYAVEIINYINKVFEYEYFTTDRMVTRENLNIEHKSIKRIFPTTEDMVVILDDRRDVWVHNTKNLINCVGYHFFTEDKQQLKNGAEKYTPFDMDNDNVLYSVEKILHFVNDSFYYYFNLFNKKPDVKAILQNKILSIFENLNFTTSGLFTKDIDIYETKQNYIIEHLGGNLWDEYDENINIVFTRKFVSTEKIRKALDDNKLVLHELWLDYSYAFFTKVDEKDFIINRNVKEIDLTKINPKIVFEKNQENIDKFYECTEENFKSVIEKIQKNHNLDKI